MKDAYILVLLILVSRANEGFRGDTPANSLMGPKSDTRGKAR